MINVLLVVMNVTWIILLIVAIKMILKERKLKNEIFEEIRKRKRVVHISKGEGSNFFVNVG